MTKKSGPTLEESHDDVAWADLPNDWRGAVARYVAVDGRVRTAGELVRAAAASAAGAREAGKRGRDTKRDEAARRRERLRVDVAAYREKHPTHGREAIAAALLHKHSRRVNHADPDDERRAVRALAKAIERAEKYHDT